MPSANVTEQWLWRHLFIGLKAACGEGISLTRHEDGVTPGTPDVSYGLVSSHGRVNGWLELKVALVTRDNQHRKPQETWLKARDVRSQQLAFLQERARTGGHCFVLLAAQFQAGQRFIALFRGEQVDLLTSSRPLDQLSRHWLTCAWGDPPAEEVWDRVADHLGRP